MKVKGQCNNVVEESKDFRPTGNVQTQKNAYGETLYAQKDTGRVTWSRQKLCSSSSSSSSDPAIEEEK